MSPVKPACVNTIHKCINKEHQCRSGIQWAMRGNYSGALREKRHSSNRVEDAYRLFMCTCIYYEAENSLVDLQELHVLLLMHSPEAHGRKMKPIFAGTEVYWEPVKRNLRNAGAGMHTKATLSSNITLKNDRGHVSLCLFTQTQTKSA